MPTVGLVSFSKPREIVISAVFKDLKRLEKSEKWLESSESTTR
jgi:hypothetical protein